MEYNWDITPLYKGFDDPAFLRDVEALQQKAADMVDFAKILEEIEPLDGLRRGTQLLEEIIGLTDHINPYIRLRLATNTTDPEAVAWQNKFNAITASYAGAEATYKLWAGKLTGLEELLEQDDVLKQYKFYYTQMADSCKYLMNSDREDAVAAMSISGSKAWAAMRGALTSHATGEYNGKTMTLTAIRALANDKQADVRREAFRAEMDIYEPIKEPLAHTINALKKATITEARMRGYESPLDRTLKKDRMQRKTLDAMFEAVKDSLPQLQRYMKTKAKYLGHKNGMPWYDISALVGAAGKTYSPEDARDYLLKTFYAFDDEMGGMMETAFRDAWIDFYAKPGKRDGAFCTSCRSLGRSWVHTNFGGGFGGVKTLAHELGHAFHNICIREHRPLNKSYGRPVSETASIFNEYVLQGAAMAEAKDPQEELAMLDKCLDAEVNLIMDIYSRFLFEDEVFRRVENEFLSADKLGQIMVNAQKAAYGDSLDPEQLHPYMWICKPHYYSYFYYNFPYIFGRLFSLGLYTQYKAEGEAFIPKYKKLLYTTSVATTEDAAKVAGIDLTTKEFWQQSLNDLIEMVDRFCTLIDA